MIWYPKKCKQNPQNLFHPLMMSTTLSGENLAYTTHTHIHTHTHTQFGIPPSPPKPKHEIWPTEGWILHTLYLHPELQLRRVWCQDCLGSPAQGQPPSPAKTHRLHACASCFPPPPRCRGNTTTKSNLLGAGQWRLCGVGRVACHMGLHDVVTSFSPS